MEREWLSIWGGCFTVAMFGEVGKRIKLFLVVVVVVIFNLK